jgi:transposase-like protein
VRYPQKVDGHLGIWAALRNVYPEALEQRCWNHRIVNVLDKLLQRLHEEAKPLLCTIPYTETRLEVEEAKQRFARWCRTRSHQAGCLASGLQRPIRALQGAARERPLSLPTGPV